MIDKNLNIIIPVDTPSGEMKVHSMPISMAAYEANYKLLALTHSDLQLLGVKTAPSVAGLTMADLANEYGLTKSYQALMAEIHRLTNVCVPTKNGFEQMPLQDVIDSNLIDEESVKYIEGRLIFFTLIRWLYPPKFRTEFVDMIKIVWGLDSTPLAITAYANSLMTSIKAAITGEKATA
jgi:hypothetical protein